MSKLEERSQSMNQHAHVDIHVLQTVPPSNLNRDDAGSPKQAVYGGARRARVSSQAWKRAARMAFAERIPEADQATRTKKLSSLLSQRIQGRTELEPDAAMRLSAGLVKLLKIPAGKKEGDTAYLLFLGHRQLDAICDLVADRASELAELDQEALAAEVDAGTLRTQLASGHPMAVALFGRMVADVPFLNVDAACQVAHAISTHPVEIEFDYYTAVDDENPDEETGAGMIGTVEFNSATLYRYATVAFPQLVENLGGDRDAALDGLDAFIDAFTRSMPTGKQNSFAHRTLPSFVAVCIRTDQPVNLVSAFETPVRSTSGVLRESVERLAEEYLLVNELWSGEPVHTSAMYRVGDQGSDGLVARAFGSSKPFPELRRTVVDELRGVAALTPA